MQVEPGLTRVDPAGFPRLKLKCDEPLSNFACFGFNFNMRPCNKAAAEACTGIFAHSIDPQRALCPFDLRAGGHPWGYTAPFQLNFSTPPLKREDDLRVVVTWSYMGTPLPVELMRKCIGGITWIS